MSEQRCGTCKYREPYYDSSSHRYMTGLKQPCVWKGDVPFYMAMLNRWVYEDDGKDCPTWHAK